MSTTDSTSCGDEMPFPELAPGQTGDLDTRSAIHDLVVAFYREIVSHARRLAARGGASAMTT